MIRGILFKVEVLIIFMLPLSLLGQELDLIGYSNSIFYNIDITQNQQNLVSDFINLCNSNDCEQSDSSCIVDAGANGFYTIQQKQNRISLSYSSFVGNIEFKDRNIKTIELYTSFDEKESPKVKRKYKEIKKAFDKSTHRSVNDTYYSNIGFCGKATRYYLNVESDIPIIQIELGFIDTTRKAVSITIRICKEK
jgi:N-acetylmuramoyl-L-alanine amidase